MIKYSMEPDGIQQELIERLKRLDNSKRSDDYYEGVLDGIVSALAKQDNELVVNQILESMLKNVKEMEENK